MTAPDALLAFAALCVEGVSRRRVRHALGAFWTGTPPQAADREVWAAIETAKSTNTFHRDLDLLAARDIQVLPRNDPAFPAQVRAIPDPPVALLVQGSVAALASQCIAIVGSRRATPNGRRIAEALATDLALQGVVVVSGLARGIDAAAHRGSLAANRPTIAVLGAGHARLYPAQHASLVRDMIDHGGSIVSEYPPHWPVRKEQFPERNRLVSGFAAGVIIVEASERSGSLITARLALEQGREVMAVPGPVGAPTSRGCHRLIKQGAALIEGPDDVWDALGVPAPGPTTRSDATPPLPTDAGAYVLAEVQFEPTPTDDIVQATGLPPSEVLRHLARLEIAGFVEPASGGYIRRPSQRV